MPKRAQHRKEAQPTKAQLVRRLQRESSRRKEAEQANRMKDEFLASLSHELRTPLQAIRSWTEILMNAPADPAKLQRALAIIKRNAKLQEWLVKDLLDVQRIVSGKFELELGEVDLGSVVVQALNSLRSEAARKGVVFVPEIQQRVIVRGDENRLLQMTVNLLANAVKFSAEKGVVNVQLGSNGEVKVVVTDKGRGISQKLLPHVFDAYRQGVGTGSPAGLGLGLAIVKTIVALHGGHVTAESHGEGEGAKFSVFLPAQILVKKPAPRPVLAELQGLVSLVVEDDDDAQLILSDILEEAGMVVHHAVNASQALKLLARTPVDVCLCDIGLPDQNGIELMRRMRKIQPDLAAIALSATDSAEDRNAALKVGFQKYIVKPVSQKELIGAIQRLTLPALKARSQRKQRVRLPRPLPGT